MRHKKVPTHYYVLTKNRHRVYKAMKDKEHNVVLLKDIKKEDGFLLLNNIGN